MMGRLLFLFALLAALGAGYGYGSGRLKWDKKKNIQFASGIHPEREVTPTEYKSFAIVLHAHNDAAWCERALTSIFAQDYDYFRVLFVDDGSSDDTFEKVQKFVLDNEQHQRVILLRNDETLGPVACLYRAIEYCLDREIIVPCSARDWLAVPTVLSRLNQAFQNPDVWLSFGQAIRYPSYEIAQPPEWKPSAIEKQGYGEPFLQVPCCFYSSLFKQLPLSELFLDGSFAKESAAYILPMLELAGGRFKSLAEPIAFDNQTLLTPTAPLVDHPSHQPLASFPAVSRSARRADLLVFSFDRPLQLYATLESICRHVAGLDRLSVLYRASDERFEAGYQELQRQFPGVKFFKQGQDPRKDFKPLVLKAIFGSPSEYILLSSDDLIVKDEVDLKTCMDAMEKTGAYGFFLRLGLNIVHSAESKKALEVPASAALTGGVLAWDLQSGQLDWGKAHNVEMTLYRKKEIEEDFRALKFKDPGSLVAAWNEREAARTIGLYFEQSKVVQLPVHAVADAGSPNYLSAEELLVKFNQRLRIDIDSLYQIENSSPELESLPDFTLR